MTNVKSADKRLVSLLLAMLMLLSFAMPAYAEEDIFASGDEVSSGDAVSSADVEEEAPPAEEAVSNMRDITASELVSEINLGWNLGESLESWASEAGYNNYYNSSAYQLLLRYDDANGERSTSVHKQFDEKNQCTISWATGLIETDSDVGLGDIGFEIWNLAVEEATTVTINVTKAKLTRRNKVVIEFEELLGEHTVTISKYGTVAVLTELWPDNISRTYGITDGTYEVTVELVDFPQMNYSKPEYFETLWNNPLTTREMITEVKRAGFNAVRVPVTFYNYVSSDSDVVDEDWLDRIQEVVDYTVQQDMYCILCMYHDGSTNGWLRVASDTDLERYSSIWTQISERFRSYDEHLLFQGYNELTDKDNTWDYPGEADIAMLNKIAQTFVDTVRASGGNNSRRCLIVMPYAGSHESDMMAGLSVSDPAEDRLIAAVNAYYPAEFAYDIEIADSGSDGEAVSSTDTASWGSDADKADLEALFQKLTQAFVNRGMPVIITEFCSADKGNTDARVAHASYYAQMSKKYGIPCFWWDDGSLLMRKSLSWSYPEIISALVDATSVHVSRLEIEIPDEIYYTGEPIYPDFNIHYYEGDVLSGSDLVSGSDIRLVEGVDYELMIFNNTDTGTATVTLSGIDRYSGFLDFSFEITEEPKAITFFTSLAKADPDLPLVIMLSIPVLLLMAGVAVYQAMRRKERERVYVTVAQSLKGAKIADTSDLDSLESSDFSYLRTKPQREPRMKASEPEQDEDSE